MSGAIGPRVFPFSLTDVAQTGAGLCHTGNSNLEVLERFRYWHSECSVVFRTIGMCFLIPYRRMKEGVEQIQEHALLVRIRIPTTFCSFAYFMINCSQSNPSASFSNMFVCITVIGNRCFSNKAKKNDRLKQNCGEV